MEMSWNGVYMELHSCLSVCCCFVVGARCRERCLQIVFQSIHAIEMQLELSLNQFMETQFL